MKAGKIHKHENKNRKLQFFSFTFLAIEESRKKGSRLSLPQSTEAAQFNEVGPKAHTGASGCRFTFP